MEYYLFDFHKEFNLLLGTRALKQLEVNIDSANNRVKLANKRFDLISSIL